MPSHRLLLHFQQDVKIEKIWKVSGMHYSRTSRAWLNKMDSNKTQILNIFNKTYGLDNAKMWFQRWRIFFMACEELFGMYNGNEWLVSHYLFEKILKVHKLFFYLVNIIFIMSLSLAENQNPYYDSSKSHHTISGFTNPYISDINQKKIFLIYIK